ncbi:MAG: hypothetical protein ABIG95_00725 [Candidatus Woesearchaeota archaeon]
MTQSLAERSDLLGVGYVAFSAGNVPQPPCLDRETLDLMVERGLANFHRPIKVPYTDFLEYNITGVADGKNVTWILRMVDGADAPWAYFAIREVHGRQFVHEFSGDGLLSRTVLRDVDGNPNFTQAEFDAGGNLSRYLAGEQAFLIRLYGELAKEG